MAAYIYDKTAASCNQASFCFLSM